MPYVYYSQMNHIKAVTIKYLKEHWNLEIKCV